MGLLDFLKKIPTLNEISGSFGEWMAKTYLTEKGVEFVRLKESIDTATPQGRFMLTVFGALAESERENILKRQREGIEIAKSEGKYKGRKPVEVDEEKFKAVCARWRAGEITATVSMQEVDL